MAAARSEGCSQGVVSSRIFAETGRPKIKKLRKTKHPICPFLMPSKTASAKTKAATTPKVKLPPLNAPTEPQSAGPPNPDPVDQRVGFALVGLGKLTLPAANVLVAALGHKSGNLGVKLGVVFYINELASLLGKHLRKDQGEVFFLRTGV